MDEPKARDLEILTLEYKLTNDQTNFLMDQRIKIFDWYSKLVLIPTAAISYFGVVYGKGNTLGHDHVQGFVEDAGWLLLAVALTGFAMFLYYCAETSNGQRYYSAVEVLRRHLKSQLSGPNQAAIMDRRGAFLDAAKYVPFFRGMAFGLMNSLVVALGTALITGGMWIGFWVYVISALLHWLVYRLIIPKLSCGAVFADLKAVTTRALRRG